MAFTLVSVSFGSYSIEVGSCFGGNEMAWLHAPKTHRYIFIFTFTANKQLHRPSRSVSVSHEFVIVCGTQRRSNCAQNHLIYNSRLRCRHIYVYICQRTWSRRRYRIHAAAQTNWRMVWFWLDKIFMYIPPTNGKSRTHIEWNTDDDKLVGTLPCRRLSCLAAMVHFIAICIIYFSDC